MSIQPNTLHVADAFDLLSQIEDGSVDLVFTDPPYNLNYGYDLHNDNMPVHEYLEWCYKWVGECARVLKPTGSLFILHLPRFAIPIGAYLHSKMIFQHWIAWKAASRNSTKPLMPEHYALLYYTKSEQFVANEVRYPHKRCRKCGEVVADYGGKKHQMHPYGPKISDVWTDIARAKHLERGDHPCKLPDKLVRRVIEFASNPGDLVLDPFMGTGTTTFVAEQLGRQFIGCDMSETYVQMAHERHSIPYARDMFNQVGSAL